MASRGKKKITMAKLNREAKLRDKREEKQARKEARKLEASRPAEDAPIDSEAASMDPEYAPSGAAAAE